MSSSEKKGVSVALGISLGAHVLLFGVLAIIQFSAQQTTASAGSITTAQISKVVQTPAIVPTPKIKPAVSKESTAAKSDNLPQRTTMPLSRQPQSEQVGELASVEPFTYSGQTYVPQTTEFFSSKTQCRKLVYVVDMSGSMLGLVPQIRAQLKSSIEQLAPDNYFDILFFGAGRISELSDGKLVRATPKAKNMAFAFIDGFKAGGTTNALDALERAMRIKDSFGNAAAQIFFLTDGFEVEGQFQNQFRAHLKNMRNSLAPDTRINTIGFWMDDEDKELLAWIASQSGGEFTHIE